MAVPTWLQGRSRPAKISMLTPMPNGWRMVCDMREAGYRVNEWKVEERGGGASWFRADFELDPHSVDKGGSMDCKAREGIVPVKKGDIVRLWRDGVHSRHGIHPRFIVMDTATAWAPGKYILAREGGIVTDADYLCICNPEDIKENLSAPKAIPGRVYYHRLCPSGSIYWVAVTETRLQGLDGGVRVLDRFHHFTDGFKLIE